MDAVVQPIDPLPDRAITNAQVILTSFEGIRIRGWYTLPMGIYNYSEPPESGLPAVLVVPGYAGRMPLPLELVHSGYATLSLFPRGCGDSLDEWQVESNTRATYHLTDRQRYYFRGAYMDCVRGLDFLASRPEVDASRLGVMGYSQGGGLTLATAALDQRVAAAVAELPWFCNLPVAVNVTSQPYHELHDYLAEHPEEREAALETLAFFDPLNLADAITCPIILSTALTDHVHPYNTVMPVFERIRSLKSIMVYPDLDHGARSDFNVHTMAWLHRYLR